MKKIVVFLLSLVLTLSLFAFTGCGAKDPVYSESFVYDAQYHWRPLIDGPDDAPAYIDYGAHQNKKGKCDWSCPYLTYTLNNQGTGLICYGAGNPDGYDKSTCWDSEGEFNVADPANNWVHVEVPETAVFNGKTYPVVELAEYAFKYDPIESLKLNEGLKIIGTQAFGYMPKLKEVIIPNSVTSVGGSLFYYSTGIENVVIGDKVPAINNYNFYNCKNLKNVKIGSSVSHLGIVAFNGCEKLEYVVLPKALKTMDQDGPSPASKYGPFSGCNTSCLIFFEALTLPSGTPSEWNPNGLKYYFGNEWEYDSNGVPRVL